MSEATLLPEDRLELLRAHGVTKAQVFGTQYLNLPDAIALRGGLIKTVYFLFYEDRLSRIGLTTDSKARVLSYRNGLTAPYDEAFFLRYTPGANTLEKFFIKMFKPPFNVLQYENAYCKSYAKFPLDVVPMSGVRPVHLKIKETPNGQAL
jgi:hypothetical protein